jgi:hypothetical protein
MSIPFRRAERGKQGLTGSPRDYGAFRTQGNSAEKVMEEQKAAKPVDLGSFVSI